MEKINGNPEIKLITVVTATYNVALTIERCVRSVVEQKSDDIEYIIIDGASTDNTMDIVRAYADKIDIILSEPDRGVYDAWNKAISMSHGRWILFLGGDDYYADGTFDGYRKFLREKDVENIDIISAKCQLINRAGTPLRIFGAEYKWAEFRNKNRLSHGSTLHNRHLFEEVGLFNLKFNINADYELLLRKRLNALFIDKVFLYMQDGGMSYSAEGLFQTFKVKRHRHSSDIIHDLYYLIKGLTGFYFRKIIWKITR